LPRHDEAGATTAPDGAATGPPRDLAQPSQPRTAGGLAPLVRRRGGRGRAASSFPLSPHASVAADLVAH
jgi:hypothetical protein